MNPVFLSNIGQIYLQLWDSYEMPITGAEGKNVDLTKFAFQQLWFFFLCGNKKDKEYLSTIPYFQLPEQQLPIWLFIILFHCLKELLF